MSAPAVLAALAVLAVLAVACSHPTTPPHRDPKVAPRISMTDDEALSVLRDMPAWAEQEDLEPAAVARIEDAAARLAALDDAALRRVFERYVEGERAAHGDLGVPAASRLYVLVRFVYAAPARAQAGLARFGAFAGIPTGPGWVDEQWPWSEREGRLHLTERFGGYFGDEYLALDELDAFRARYGRRKQAP